MKDGTYRLDRIEEGTALLEDENGGTVPIPAKGLPAGCAEGAVLRAQGGTLRFDEGETQKRRRSLFALAKRLAEKE